ncbi:MAG TPA: MBL fold metallo-hydrolase [Pyrinomonadaceae bacterium]|nr:MBL fold metallo-hydrolase [Pyrinomonadaceae bacterium]
MATRRTTTKAKAKANPKAKAKGKPKAAKAKTKPKGAKPKARPKSKPKTASKAKAKSRGDKVSVRIRMYRQGLGDCFLLTFQQQGKEDFNMMVDCGLLQGTRNSTEIMKQVVENVESTLSVSRKIDGEQKKWLDVVVLTHEHADHISGFGQAQDIFNRIHFGEVWAGWMDDESHPKYKAVRERFHKQVTGLRAALARMKSDAQQGLKETVTHLLEDFFDENVLGVEDNVLGAKATKTKRTPAWEFALNKSVKDPRFCRPGSMFTLPGFDDIRIYILGPSENYDDFTKVDPSEEDTYRSEGSGFALADSFFAAVAEDSDLFDAELRQPFENHLRIDADVRAKEHDFFKTHYGFDEQTPDPSGKKDPNAWRRINDDWLSMAGSLALKLDSYTNNTCLAFAIEFVSSQKVLLFPGDAQFSNWLSWQELTWQIPDEKGVKQEVKAEHLLNRTVFYKVGHHGSHNATLKKHGLEMMISPELMAMIPVDRAKAESKVTKTNPKGWEMPEKNLFTRLQERTRGRVLLADEKDDKKLKVRCNDSNFLKKVKFDGSLARDAANPTAKEPIAVELIIEG